MGSISNPRYFLPERMHATAVVPEPMNGSRTVWPGSVLFPMRVWTMLRGLIVGWSHWFLSATLTGVAYHLRLVS